MTGPNRPDEITDWGTCHADGCDEPAPWDMSAILADGSVYCSPKCARENVPEESLVYLHDPQDRFDPMKFGMEPDAFAFKAPGRGVEAVNVIDNLALLPWRPL